MKSVYLETTVIGHIAGRLHPNANVLARQQITREWWATAQTRYRLLASDLVLAESGDGDSEAAQERLNLLNDIELLQATDAAKGLAAALIDAVCRAGSRISRRNSYCVGCCQRNGLFGYMEFQAYNESIDTASDRCRMPGRRNRTGNHLYARTTCGDLQ